MASLRHIGGTLRAFVRADRRTRRAHLETLVLDRVVRRPIVYTDDRGLHYVLYPGENAGVYIRSGGNYEASEERFCETHLGAGDTMVDVGGNIGLYALLAAKLVGDTGTVHSFEPEPRNAARLRANLALNGFANVEVFEAAVYSEPGTVALNVFDARFNAWHSIGRPSLPDPADARRTIEPTETRDVPAVTLDDHCARHGMSRIDLLKIDVEGAEVDVLGGARTLLASHAVRAILFEISLPQIEALGHAADAPFTLLREHGYRCFELAPDGGPGAPVATTTTRYANYVALAPAA